MTQATSIEEISVEITTDYKNNPNIRPWVRYVARHIDLGVCTLVFGLTFGVLLVIGHLVGLTSDQQIQAMHQHKLTSLINIVTGMLVLIFSMIAEAVMLHLFGYTLGKWLLNVKVRDNNGEKLTLNASFKRAFGVLFYGLGLGVPLINIYTQVCTYSDITTQGRTRWDKSAKLVVTHEPISYGRWIFAIFLLTITQLALFMPILVKMANHS